MHALVVLTLLSATPSYGTIKSDLATLKARAAADFGKATTQKQKTAVLAKARADLLTAFDQNLFPIWSGTPWNFYGTTETPQEGHIACGYFVSTLMRDAGFDVERVKLAQQASEYIVKTLAAPEDTKRFRNVEKPKVIDELKRSLGDGPPPRRQARRPLPRRGLRAEGRGLRRRRVEPWLHQQLPRGGAHLFRRPAHCLALGRVLPDEDALEDGACAPNKRTSGRSSRRSASARSTKS